MYFPCNWEFGSALSKLRNNFGGGVWTPNPPPPGYASGRQTSMPPAGLELSIQISEQPLRSRIVEFPAWFSSELKFALQFYAYGKFRTAVSPFRSAMQLPDVCLLSWGRHCQVRVTLFVHVSPDITTCHQHYNYESNFITNFNQSVEF
jgi:hypothetical protein